MNSRPYRMGKRLEDVDETRRRIVDAAVALHGSVGPARTTISAVAARAGVQRSTVYRHFPDDEALFAACSAHWRAGHPWPDHRRWAGIADPLDRLRAALGEVYRYYGANRAMLGNLQRDREVLPEPVQASRAAQTKATAESLAGGFRLRGRRRARVAAAVGHALEFSTFESLTGAGLSAAEAAGLAADMVAGAAGTPR